MRTNTPCKGFIAAASMLPLFVPPLVAGVAWSILASPKTGLLNTMLEASGIDLRFNVYSMGGLIVIFGIYYAPYVYMFTASALRNMDPALEEAAEVSGASAFSTLFTVTFPLIAPAIISGMLLSFIVMLGIYGIPAVLGTPGDIPVLTTYIFKLTNWSPPLYSTAAAVAIILMVVTGFLVWLQQRVLSRPQLHHGRRQGVPAARAQARAVALFHARPRASLYLFVVVVLPTLALIVAAFRKFLFIRNIPSLFDMKQYSLIHFERLFDNPLAMRSIVNTMEVGFVTAIFGGMLAFAIGYTVQPHAGCRPRRASTSSRRCRSRSPASSSASPICGPGSACPAASTARSGSWRSPSSPASCRTPSRRSPPRCMQIHRELEEAAWICGRGLLGTIRTIVLPLARPGVDRRDDAAVHPGDPRARLVAVPLHQQHDGDGGAAARLLRGRQCRHHGRLQPGADRAARRADRRRAPAVARRRRSAASAAPADNETTKGEQR